MNDRPIGVFDSGVGGLTVVRELQKLLPHESLIYYGDTARVPYGNKGAETIIRYSLDIGRFLVDSGVKAIVVACNTASAYAVESLREAMPVPVIDVIVPAARAAAATAQRIAFLGTRATIRSRMYEAEIRRYKSSIELLAIACPLFVPLVEEQFLQSKAAALIVEEYLKPVRSFGPDTLLLGCTHYPLLKTLIQDYLGPSVAIVDSGVATATALMTFLTSKEMLSCSSSPYCHCFVSDDPAHFSALSEALLGLRYEARHHLLQDSAVV